jgi:hypothetical protein
MPGEQTLTQLTQMLSARSSRFHGLFNTALAQMSSNDPCAISTLESCRAEAEGILQDQALIAQRQQDLWKGQLANVLHSQAQVFTLCCRFAEARKAIQEARTFLPMSSSDPTEGWLDAQEARVAEQDGIGDPLKLYDRAIAGLTRIGFWQDAAQINDQAATWAIRNGQYEASHKYTQTGIDISEKHALPWFNIKFRIRRVRSELIAANSALDLDGIRKDIDYVTDLGGDIGARLNALYEDVPAAFASAESQLNATPEKLNPEAIAQAIERLSSHAAAFAQAVVAMRLDQASKLISAAPTPESLAPMLALIKETKPYIENAYLSLRADALILATEFKSKLADVETAHEALDEAERVCANNAAQLTDVYMARANLFEAQNDLKSAIAAAERAVQVSQGLFPILAEQAVLKLNRLRAPVGLESPASSIEDEVYNIIFRAVELLKAGNFNDALPVLNSALAIANTPTLRRAVLDHRAIGIWN